MFYSFFLVFVANNYHFVNIFVHKPVAGEARQFFRNITLISDFLGLSKWR